MKSKISLKHIVISIIIAFAILVILAFRSALIRVQIGANLVWHSYAYKEVEKFYKKHGLVPEQLDSLRKAYPEYYAKMQYFPESWGKRDAILLYSTSRGKDYTTYGNGDVFAKKKKKVILKDNFGEVVTYSNDETVLQK